MIIKVLYKMIENFPTSFLPLLPLSSQFLHLPPTAPPPQVKSIIQDSSESPLQGMFKTLKTFIWNDLSKIQQNGILLNFNYFILLKLKQNCWAKQFKIPTAALAMFSFMVLNCFH